MDLQYNNKPWSDSSAAANKHPDGNREIRSMAITSLPLPPLPLMVCKELDDEHSYVEAEHKLASSHDLIAHLMNVACAVASSSVNNKRMEKQAAVVQSLFARVDSWQDEHDSESVPDEDWCYELVAEFTRQYVGSYLFQSDSNAQRGLDLRFAPADQISKEHVVYRKALEFQKAQDILYGAASTQSLDLCDMSFAQLVQHSIRRMLDARTLGPHVLE